MSRVLELGTLAALAWIVARCTGTKVLKVWELPKVPIEAASAFFVGFTMAHAFCGYFLQNVTLALQRSPGDMAEKVATYEDLVSDAGLYVAVGVPRVVVPGRRLVTMSWRDPSTWAAYGGALVLLAAMLPWRWDGGLSYLGWRSGIALTALALLVVCTNWLIGTHYTVAISSLVSPQPAPHALDFMGSGAGGLAQLHVLVTLIFCLLFLALAVLTLVVAAFVAVWRLVV